jgi:hypothetical protein
MPGRSGGRSPAAVRSAVDGWPRTAPGATGRYPGWRQGCGGDRLLHPGANARQRHSPTSPSCHRPGPRADATQPWCQWPVGTNGPVPVELGLHRAERISAEHPRRPVRLPPGPRRSRAPWVVPSRYARAVHVPHLVPARELPGRADPSRRPGRLVAHVAWAPGDPHPRGPSFIGPPRTGSDPGHFLSVRHIAIASAGSPPAGPSSLSGEACPRPSAHACPGHLLAEGRTPWATEASGPAGRCALRAVLLRRPCAIEIRGSWSIP